MELDPTQAAVATSPAQALLVDAGPGSGKTRALACRTAHMVAERRFRPEQIAGLTYTRAMAADLRRRVALAMPPSMPCDDCGETGTLGGFVCSACAGTGRWGVGRLAIGTLHSLAARWIRDALAGRIAGGAAVRATGWVEREDFCFADDQDVADLVRHAQEVVGKKKITQSALREGLWLVGPKLAAWPEQAEARRQLVLRGLITYDDVLGLLLAMLEADDNAAPRLADAFPCLLVDERQDLTPLHWRIFEAWNPASITAVGDDAQAIFGFLRGGGAAQDAGALRFHWDRSALGMNYRSARGIARVLGHVRAQLAADGGCTPLLQAAACNEPGTFWHLRADDDGVRLAGDAVTAFLDAGQRPASIAVLAATWAELDLIRAELESLGVPASVPAGGRQVWRAPVGRMVVSMARTAMRRGLDQFEAGPILRGLALDDRALPALLDQAFRIGRSLASELDATARAPGAWWSRVAACESIADLASLAREVAHMAGPGVLDVAERLDRWSATDPTDATPAAWLAWLASSDEAIAEEHADAVSLRTVHSAKGLEWDCVVVYGACEGAIPPSWAKTQEDELEWGRALYVALSRARKSLAVVSPGILRGKPRQPTRWLPIEAEEETCRE